MLKETDGVLEVTSVPEAFVPIIKCTFQGIDIDLLFARLALPTIPDDLELKDDNLLRNLDERCVRSLGGSRVTDEMLRLVPDVPVFRDALRTIKLWAQRASSSPRPPPPRRRTAAHLLARARRTSGVRQRHGFLRRCRLGHARRADMPAVPERLRRQHHLSVRPLPLSLSLSLSLPQPRAPTDRPLMLARRFFIIMHQWQWPAPVLLKPIEEGPLQVRVWNPKVRLVSSRSPHPPRRRSSRSLSRSRRAALPARPLAPHADHHAGVPVHVLDPQRHPQHAADHDGRVQARCVSFP